MNAPVVPIKGDVDDIDRARPGLPPLDVLARHLDGRYTVDQFGADPQVQDLVAPLLDFGVRVTVEGSEHIPTNRAGVLVCNRGFGLVEAAVVNVGVRQTVGRRVRVVGAPDVPIADTVARKLGVIGADPHEVSACLRAGHLVALPMSRTWVRTAAGVPPQDLLFGALGFEIYPCAIRPLGMFGLPLRGWEMRIGEMITLDAGDHPVGDPLAAAELSSRVHAAVSDLLV